MCYLRNLTTKGNQIAEIGHCRTRNERLVGEDEQITWHNNFEVKFSEWVFDVATGSFFEFGVIWESTKRK